jgi:hypothetical protein
MALQRKVSGATRPAAYAHRCAASQTNWSRKNIMKLVNTLEKIMLLKKMPYWIYWPGIGLLAFLGGELILTATNDHKYFLTQLFFAILIGSLPISFIWLGNNFQHTFKELCDILWDSSEECEVWIGTRIRRIFTLKTFVAKVVVLGSLVLASITVLSLGLPFDSLISNVIGFGAFLFLTFIGGVGGYTLFDLLVVLSEITRRPANVPFYLFPNSSIEKLQNYYSMAVMVAPHLSVETD